MAGIDRFGQKGAEKKVPQEASKPSFLSRRRQAIDYDWRAFSCVEFAAALGTLSAHGLPVMVGGAHGGRGALITIYINKERDRTFVANAGELLDWCHDVLEYYGSASEDVYMSYGIKRRGEA